MNLSAQLPRVAALIYRHKFYNGKLIPADESLDSAANYSHMLGHYSEVFYECFREKRYFSEDLILPLKE